VPLCEIWHKSTVNGIQIVGDHVLSGSTDRTLKAVCLKTLQQEIDDPWNKGARATEFDTDIGGLTCMHATSYSITFGSYDETIKIWYFAPIEKAIQFKRQGKY